MDQSFSVDNFKKILSYENRRGRNLEKEFFPEIFTTTKAITEINIKIHGRLRLKIKDDVKLKALVEEKVNKGNYKKELIEKELTNVSEKLLDPKFKIKIEQVETDDKPVYVTIQNSENYFAIKQLQLNVKKSFKVKQANRFAIINQLYALVTDNFPKVIIRTDIKSFYESIPHNKLRAKIIENPLFSFLSKKLIWNILTEFLTVSKATEKKGIPRGIGVCAYLAELYMRDIDNEISSLKDVTYYARYVDDIIIVFTPTSIKEAHTYEENVRRIIETDTGLKMNPDSKKTAIIELIKCNKAYELNYLGYRFEFKDLEFKKIRLTERKLNKYKERVKQSIAEYNLQCRFDTRGARRTLIHRLNFLTGNTRLENNKANVLVGIFYTNSLLTEPFEDLTELDNLLGNEIDTNISSEGLRKRLKQFSFKKGFVERKFVNFSSHTKKISLTEILNAF